MKSTIVTGSDSGMFELLLDLIHSLRALPPAQLADVDVCVLDAGMTPEQLAILTPLVTRVAPAQWDLDFDNARLPSWFKLMVARPHLPRYFPEYDLLLWIDADAWACNADAIKLMLRAADAYGLAIVPELDRAYLHCFHLLPVRAANIEQTYHFCFGEGAALQYGRLPVLNVGVFAVRRDSPAWSVWSDLLGQALRRSPRRRMAEQCSLNLAVFTGRVSAHLLPTWCNWICPAATPVLDPAAGTLHSPFLPHERISIVHLTDLKAGPVDVRCFKGPARRTPLTYRAIRGETGPPTTV